MFLGEIETKFILSNVIFVLVVSLIELNKVDCNADCFNTKEHSSSLIS